MLINWRGNRELSDTVLGWRSEGKTFGQIAAVLTERFGEKITRNQIAGFLTRNYTGEPIKFTPVKKEKPSPKPKVEKVALPIARLFVVEEPPAVLTEAGGVTLEELDFRSCRWPLGDPRLENFRYCGDRRELGVSYCAGHMRLAYRVQPAITRAEAKAAHVRNLQMLRVNHRIAKDERRRA